MSFHRRVELFCRLVIIPINPSGLGSSLVQAAFFLVSVLGVWYTISADYVRDGERVGLFEDVGSNVQSAMCSYLSIGKNLTNWANGANPLSPLTPNIPGILHSMACDLPVADIDPEPQFDGGCNSAPYRVTATLTTTQLDSNDVESAPSTVVTAFDVTGPVVFLGTAHRRDPPRDSGLRTFDRVEWRYSVASTATGGTTLQFGRSGDIFSFEFSIDVMRLDGGNDSNCPSNPPITEDPRGAPFPAIPSVTVNVGGVDVDVNIDVGGIRIGPEGDINVDVDIDYGGRRGPGIVPISPRVPPIFRPRGPLGDRGTPDLIDEIADWLDLISDAKDIADTFLPPFDDLIDPPNRKERRLIGVRVQLNELKSTRQTFVTGTDGADWYLPALGYVNFIYDYRAGDNCRSQDFALKKRSHAFFTPYPSRTIDYEIHGVDGNTFLSAPIWATVEELGRGGVFYPEPDLS